MELERYKRAQEIQEELDELKRHYNYVVSSDFQTSLENIVLYDGFPYEGNLRFIEIRHPLIEQLKDDLKGLMKRRIVLLEQQFKEL